MTKFARPDDGKFIRHRRTGDKAGRGWGLGRYRSTGREIGRVLNPLLPFAHPAPRGPNALSELSVSATCFT